MTCLWPYPQESTTKEDYKWSTDRDDEVEEEQQADLIMNDLLSGASSSEDKKVGPCPTPREAQLPSQARQREDLASREPCSRCDSHRPCTCMIRDLPARLVRQDGDDDDGAEKKHIDKDEHDGVDADDADDADDVEDGEHDEFEDLFSAPPGPSQGGDAGPSMLHDGPGEVCDQPARDHPTCNHPMSPWLNGTIYCTNPNQFCCACNPGPSAHAMETGHAPVLRSTSYVIFCRVGKTTTTRA